MPKFVGPDGTVYPDGRYGSKAKVWHGKCYQTPGGKVKADLDQGRDGRIKWKDRSDKAREGKGIKILMERGLVPKKGEMPAAFKAWLKKTPEEKAAHRAKKQKEREERAAALAMLKLRTQKKSNDNGK